MDSILLILVASTVLKWQSFKLLKWVQLLNRVSGFGEILCVDDNIKFDLDSILLNDVDITISKWR
jgi:hypothetical protein